MSLEGQASLGSSSVLTRAVTRLLGLDEPETSGDVWRFRLLEVFLLAYAVYWAWDWGLFVQGMPALVAPQGLTRHVDLSWLVGSPLALGNAALVTACAVGASWRRTARVCLPLLLLSLHVAYVLRFSLGKLTHGSQYVGLGLLSLALAAWCMPTPSTRRRFALGATRLFMGAGYVCAALSKLAARGIEWRDGQHLWLWIAEKNVDALADAGHTQLNVLQQLCLEHLWLATVVLTLGLLAELGGFLLWFSATRTATTLTLIGLHLGIYWSLGILFDTYMLQLSIVGLPLARLFDRVAGSERVS